MDTNSNTLLFVEQLVQSVPELRNLYEDHIKDNDEVLPHVFLGDVTRFAMAESSNGERVGALTRLFTHLETGLANSNEAVKELVVVSFVEGLCGEESALRLLKPLMGSKLRMEVEQICEG